jgi:hypothetical protein
MMLAQQPSTELDYWQALEACEKTALKLRDGLRRRLIPQNEVNNTKQAIEQAESTATALLLELERKFNVFCYKNHPSGTAKPKGMQNLIDWWNKMDKLVAEQATMGDAATT